jgi:hypothetical protein
MLEHRGRDGRGRSGRSVAVFRPWARSLDRLIFRLGSLDQCRGSISTAWTLLSSSRAQSVSFTNLLDVRPGNDMIRLFRGSKSVLAGPKRPSLLFPCLFGGSDLDRVVLKAVMLVL